MSDSRLKRSLTGIGAGLMVATLAAWPLQAGAQVVNPDATLVVSNLTPREGETITVQNAPNADSTCEDGLAVILVSGFPPGPAFTDTPDVNGNWSINLTIPIQADFTNADVGGPFTLNAICDATFGGDASSDQAEPTALPSFAYQPVVVTVQSDPPPPVNPPTEEPTGGASQSPSSTGPVTARPVFTG